MKRVRQTKRGIVFEFSPGERNVFCSVLRLYPLLNPDYHRLSKSADPERIADSEALLREALRAQHREHKAMVRQLVLKRHWRLQSDTGAFRLTLSPQKIDQLLQVLNDVRVGSWVLLDRPDTQRGEPIEATEATLQYAVALEVSGYFQTLLLHALEEATEPRLADGETS